MEVIKGFKVRIHPTKEQVKTFYQYSDASRFVHNWSLGMIIGTSKEGPSFNSLKLSNRLTAIQHDDPNFKWLLQYPAQLKADAVEDCQDAMKKFFKGLSDYPVFKKKHKSRIKFSFSPTGPCTPKDGYIKVPKLENILGSKQQGKIKINTKDKMYDVIIENRDRLTERLNISFDGKYWYLSGAYKCNIELSETNDNIIGIDLGLKDLVITNKGYKSGNINKTKQVKKLNKKIKRLQRSVSRKLELNKDGKKFIHTKNKVKTQNKIKLLFRRLTNIRNNNILQITNSIAKTKPSRVVMEDLNISGMMRNKHLVKSIQEAKWYYFKTCMEWKCKLNNIEFKQVPRFYASSKTCSSCGNRHPNLKLKDRIYDCPKCGLSIDRDINATINLANYKFI